jgi:thioredoxin 1
MSDNITHVTDGTFKAEVIDSGLPVLVDYWAEWCGPCKMIAPVLEYAGRLRVAKMDIDSNQATPAQFGIRGIPTLMLFKGGQLAGQKVGALSKGQLSAFLDSHL